MKDMSMPKEEISVLIKTHAITISIPGSNGIQEVEN